MDNIHQHHISETVSLVNCSSGSNVDISRYNFFGCVRYSREYQYQLDHHLEVCMANDLSAPQNLSAFITRSQSMPNLSVDCQHNYLLHGMDHTPTGSLTNEVNSSPNFTKTDIIKWLHNIPCKPWKSSSFHSLCDPQCVKNTKSTFSVQSVSDLCDVCFGPFHEHQHDEDELQYYARRHTIVFPDSISTETIPDTMVIQGWTINYLWV